MIGGILCNSGYFVIGSILCVFSGSFHSLQQRQNAFSTMIGLFVLHDSGSLKARRFEIINLLLMRSCYSSKCDNCIPKLMCPPSPMDH